MAMKLPSSPETHVTEAASWRLLQNLAPETWIVREVTERDYGIDAYIEIATAAGEITGELSRGWRYAGLMHRMERRVERSAVSRGVGVGGEMTDGIAAATDFLPMRDSRRIAQDCAFTGKGSFFCRSARPML